MNPVATAFVGLLLLGTVSVGANASAATCGAGECSVTCDGLCQCTSTDGDCSCTCIESGGARSSLSIDGMTGPEVLTDPVMRSDLERVCGTEVIRKLERHRSPIHVDIDRKAPAELNRLLDQNLTKGSSPWYRRIFRR